MKFVRKHINEAVRLPSADSQKKITLTDIQNINAGYQRQQIHDIINKVLNTCGKQKYINIPVKKLIDVYYKVLAAFPHVKTTEVENNVYRYDFSPAIISINVTESGGYAVRLAVKGDATLDIFTDVSDVDSQRYCLYIDAILDYIASHSDNLIKSISLCYVSLDEYEISHLSRTKDLPMIISKCNNIKYDMSVKTAGSGTLKLPLCSKYDMSVYDIIFKFFNRFDNIDFSHIYNIVINPYITSISDHDITDDLHSIVQMIKSHNIVCDCISPGRNYGASMVPAFLSEKDFTYMLDIANDVNTFYIRIGAVAFKDYKCDIKWPVFTDSSAVKNFYEQVAHTISGTEIRYYVKDNILVASRNGMQKTLILN